MGGVESKALKKSKNKCNFKNGFDADLLREQLEVRRLEKMKGKKDIFETTFIDFDHIFSGDHIDKGILNLGSGKIEIVEEIQDLVRSLYKEKKLMFGSNQIQAILNGLKVEFRVYISADDSVLSLNIFLPHSKRIFKNNIKI